MQFQRGADGTARVVAARHRNAEQRHHLVADKLVHASAVALYHRAGLAPDARHDLLHLLGVESLVQRGVTRKVREHHGGMAAFAFFVGHHRNFGGGQFGLPCWRIRCGGLRGRRLRRCLRMDRLEQPLAVAQRRHAEFLQVGIREVWQQIYRHILRDELPGVLAKLMGIEPGLDVGHRKTDKLGGRGSTRIPILPLLPDGWEHNVPSARLFPGATP